ncbi:MAG: DUF1549 domain-containing protein [Planctomycetota bacterium]
MRPTFVLPAVLSGLLAAQAPPPATTTTVNAAAAARGIDQLVARDLAARGERPRPIVDDATFVRRAYLAIIGRIPSVAELSGALTGGGDRRAALIDRLVGTPGHQSHLFNWFADLLRAKTRLNRQVSGEPYLHWIKASLAANTHYDVMVHELLAAEGPAYARGNGATGYHLRDLAMPEDDVANTMRLFLGTRIECAQCHNHPFDKWKQKEFYELVAFNGGMQYRSGPDAAKTMQGLRDTARKMVAEHGQKAQQAIRQIVQVATVGISGSGTGYTRLPSNYQYADARGNEAVAARVPFGNQVVLDLPAPRPGARQPRRQPRRAGPAPVGVPADTRSAFADWVTSDENERFASVIANRYWQRTFGRALIEPLDDLRDDTQASNPELMRYLSDLLVRLDYDLRAFERVLLHTELFQREVVEGDGGEVASFAGPYLRRMSAEQVWDSLLTLVLPDVDATLRPAGARAEEVYARYEHVASATPDELARDIEVGMLRQTDPQKFRAMMRERQAAAMAQRDGERDERIKQARPMFRQLALARRRGDAETVAKLEAQLRQLGVPLPGERTRRDPGNQALLRASDLPSPAPSAHLLREFGQSDRETIEAGFTEASVPQVLTLLNGFIDQRLLDNRNATLRRLIDGEKSASKKVEVSFLAVLGRRPTAAELATWSRGKDLDATVRDLVWVLINSHEFRTLR